MIALKNQIILTPETKSSVFFPEVIATMAVSIKSMDKKKSKCKNVLGTVLTEKKDTIAIKTAKILTSIDIE